MFAVRTVCSMYGVYAIVVHTYIGTVLRLYAIMYVQCYAGTCVRSLCLYGVTSVRCCVRTSLCWYSGVHVRCTLCLILSICLPVS